LTGRGVDDAGMDVLDDLGVEKDERGGPRVRP
jgi:hypothetical protein